MHLLRSLCVLMVIAFAVRSDAGQPPRAPAAPAQPSPSPSLAETTASDRREAMNDQKDWHFIGHVEMDRDPQGLSKV